MQTGLKKILYSGFLLFGMLGALLGFSAYTFHYAQGTSYLSNDPKACVNCHVMSDHYAGWQKSSHHFIATCNECHTPQEFIPKYLTKMEQGFWHSKGFTFQDFEEPIQLRPSSKVILQDNCLRCHQQLVHEIQVNRGNLEDDVQCVRCHGEVGHGQLR